SGSVEIDGLFTDTEMGLLREGDGDNDNCVSLVDFNILKSTFGRSSSDPGYDASADFNGDNTISLGDFHLLRSNFGSCVAGPVRAAGIRLARLTALSGATQQLPGRH